MLSEEEEDEEIDRGNVESDNDTDLPRYGDRLVPNPLATSLNHVIYNIKKIVSYVVLQPLKVITVIANFTANNPTGEEPARHTTQIAAHYGVAKPILVGVGPLVRPKVR